MNSKSSDPTQTETTPGMDEGARVESPQPENTQPRFCSSCGRTKPVLGGSLVRCANGAKRWKCADCIARSKAHLASRQAPKT
jgi:hypothetical protein